MESPEIIRARRNKMLWRLPFVGACVMAIIWAIYWSIAGSVPAVSEIRFSNDFVYHLGITVSRGFDVLGIAAFAVILVIQWYYIKKQEAEDTIGIAIAIAAASMAAIAIAAAVAGAAADFIAIAIVVVVVFIAFTTMAVAFDIATAFIAMPANANDKDDWHIGVIILIFFGSRFGVGIGLVAGIFLGFAISFCLALLLSVAYIMEGALIFSVLYGLKRAWICKGAVVSKVDNWLFARDAGNSQS